VGTAREASDDGRIYPTLCPTTRAVNNMQVRLVSEKTIPSSARNHGFARARLDFNALALVSFPFEFESLCGSGPARATFDQKGNETRLFFVLVFLSLSFSLPAGCLRANETLRVEGKSEEDRFPDPSQSRILLRRM